MDTSVRLSDTHLGTLLQESRRFFSFYFLLSSLSSLQIFFCFSLHNFFCYHGLDHTWRRIKGSVGLSIVASQDKILPLRIHS